MNRGPSKRGRRGRKPERNRSSNNQRSSDQRQRSGARSGRSAGKAQRGESEARGGKSESGVSSIHKGLTVPKNNIDLTMPDVPEKVGVAFFDSIEQARNAVEKLKVKAKEYDQFNIVIRKEGAQTDEVLDNLGVIYAGEAWTTIHERRIEDGFYQDAIPETTEEE